jgi:hypothetical protein
MRSFVPYAFVTAAVMAMSSSVAGQQWPFPEALHSDLMIGTFACTVEHMAGIQSKDDKAAPVVGSIRPATEKFVLTITVHSPPEWCKVKESKEAFPELCSGRFAAKMSPRLTNEGAFYGTTSNIFFSQMPIAYLWIAKDMRFSVGITAFNSTYAIQGSCSRFANAAPSR